MQLSDRITGIGVAGLGTAVFFAARQLPPMPGQQIGPSVFPAVVGLALAVCGVLIALGVGKSFEAADPAVAEHDATHQGDDAKKAPSPWTVLVPIALLLFYVAAVGTMGFVLVAAVMVLAMSLVLGASPKLAFFLALVAPPVVYLIFARVLRVPLPTGWLTMPW